MPIELWRNSSTQNKMALALPSILKFYDFLVAYIEQLGISVHHQSRLAKYKEITAKCFNAKLLDNNLDNQELMELSFAYAEIIQLAVIVYYGQVNIEDLEYRGKIEQLLKDAVNPLSTNKVETPGRNTQFELFVAACWKQIGTECRIFPPPHPDILLKLDGYDFGIEVKRMKSLRTLGKRFKKAKKQLHNARNGGVIAMDFSIVLRKERQEFSAISLEHAIADLEKRLRLLMFDNLDTARKRGKSKKSFGWFGFAQAIYIVDGDKIINAYQWKNINLCPENDRRWLLIAQKFPYLVSVMETAFNNLCSTNDNLIIPSNST